MDRLKHARFVLLFILIILIAGSVHAQNWSYSYNGKQYSPYVKRWTMGIGVGLAAYNGELSTFFQPKLQHYYLNPGFNFNMHYRLTDRISIRGEMTLFSLYSESEADSTQCSYEEFSFRSFNYQYYLAAVFDLFPKGKVDGLMHRWDAHLFVGIGHVLFFPRDVVGGTARTGTEIHPANCNRAEGIEFSKLSATVPIGIGVKRYLNKDVFIAFELGYRGDELARAIGILEQTDFLDAIRESGNDKLDKYALLNFKVNWVIGKEKDRTFNYNIYKNQRNR